MPRFSIITITYNDAHGLQRTIESVLGQNYTDFEFIIVDGASTDGTNGVLSGLPSYVKIISEPDHGRYDAMNKGADIAQGEFLWFLHGGDKFASTDVLKNVANSLNSDTEWGFGLSRLLTTNRPVGVFGQPSFDIRRFALGGKPVSHQAMIISRNLHERIGGYDRIFGLAADQFYILKAALQAPPQIWCDFLCDFDNSGAGSTRRAYEHYRDMMRGRKLLNYSPTGSPLADLLLTVVLAVRATFLRFRGSLTKKIASLLTR